MAYPPAALPTNATDGASPTDTTPTAVLTAAEVNAMNAAVNDVVSELGANPSGAAADVGARLAAIESAAAALPGTYAPIAGDGYDDLGYDVFVLLGQSNMVGYGTTISLTYSDPTHPDVWRWVASGSGVGALASHKSKITLASDPLGHPDTLTGVGPGMEFARQYVRGLKASRRVLLVPVAVQATPLVTATPPTWNSTVTGSLLDNAIDYANAAIAAAGSNARLKGFLWVQGETDAQSSVTGSAYQVALDALIAKLRAQVTGASATTPFVIGSIVPSYSTGTTAAVNAAQAGTPSRVANTAYAVGPTGSGDVHYTEAEQRTLGASLLTAYRAALTSTLAPAVPGAPTGLTAAAANAQVVLGWSAPTVGYPAVTDYIVQHSTDGTTWTTFADGTGTTTSTTVTGLTNGTAYTFRVAAVNATGQGPYSATISATPSAVVTYLSDNFNRADTVSGLGTSSGGQSWAAASSYRVLGNLAQSLTQGGGNFTDPALCDVGVTSYTVQATARGTQGVGVATGLVFRAVDKSNGWFTYAATSGTWNLTSMTAGGGFAVRLSSGVTATDGDVLKVVVTPTLVTFYVNGVLAGTSTDTTHAAGTKVGFTCGGAAAGGWDDLLVTA